MAFSPENEIAACFALVRPGGMSDNAAREWLTVAVGEVKHLPEQYLRAKCAEARQTCKFPSEIVPTILKGWREVEAYKASLDASTSGFLRQWHGTEQRQLGGPVKRIGHLKLVPDASA